MSDTQPQAGPTCARCRQTLPPEVSFCASCGFDNGEILRMGKKATFDQKIEEHLAWMRFKQFLDAIFLRWWM